MSERLDLTGQKFNRLTCIKCIGSNKRGLSIWLCKCDCGNIITALGYQVKNGNTKSCGCLKREVIIKRNTIHGLCFDKNGKKSRLYGMWHRMKQRCFDSNCDDFKLYGNRGITVCKEWLDYKPFHDWAMSHGYKKGLMIERNNNNGNYHSDNCEWATAKQQARNKRNSRFIIYLGKRKTLAEWSEILNIGHKTLFYRLKNWSVEEAFTTSVTKGGKRGYYENKTDIIEEFCKRTGDKSRV